MVKPTTVDPLKIREIPVEQPPALVHRQWADDFPWLVQGTTRSGSPDVPFDLGLFNAGSSDATVRGNWERLRRSVGVTCIVHARQVHGAEVRVYGADVRAHANDTGLRLVEPCDGHATAEPDVALAVATADCVPVFIVDPKRRTIALLHAGWRGAAEGVVERGLSVIASVFGSLAEDVHMHLGPAICGDCYEVGPEVFQALGRTPPSGPVPIDLRGILADRATLAGVDARSVSISEHCTRCTDSGLFSHRGGDPYRQVGYLGIRA